MPDILLQKNNLEKWIIPFSIRQMRKTTYIFLETWAFNRESPLLVFPGLIAYKPAFCFDSDSLRRAWKWKIETSKWIPALVTTVYPFPCAMVRLASASRTEIITKRNNVCVASYKRLRGNLYNRHSINRATQRDRSLSILRFRAWNCPRSEIYIVRDCFLML